MLQNPTIFDIAIFGIGSIMFSLATIYSWITILNKSFNLKDKNFIFGLIISSIVTGTMTLYLAQEVKMSLMMLILIIINYLFFSKNMKNAIIGVTLSELIIMISEFIFVLLSTVLGYDMNDISSTAVGQTIINSTISLISFLIINFIKNFKLYISIIK